MEDMQGFVVHLDEYHKFLLILPLLLEMRILLVDTMYRKDHVNMRETAKQEPHNSFLHTHTHTYIY